MTQITISLPKPHVSQKEVIKGANRFNILVNGRRWGKTTLGLRLMKPAITEAWPIAYFAPTYKTLSELWIEAKHRFEPVIAEKFEQTKQMRLINGGIIDFWSCENKNPGRGRKYKRAIVDEFEMIGKDQKEVWERAILPTLTDLSGDAYLLSTPKGKNTYFHDLYQKAAEKDYWARWQMPTVTNPHINPNEIEIIRQSMDDVSFRQEYMAEFVDYANNPFAYAFNESKHVKPVSFTPGEALWISFDFNVNPITAIAGQTTNDYMHILKEYRIENSNIYELTDRIKNDWPNANLFITGDSTGNNRSAITQGNINYYTIIQKALGLAPHQLKVPRVNPSHMNSRVLCNSILTHHPNVYIDPSCKHLITDMRYVEIDQYGHIQKDKDLSKTHLLDAWRYLVWVTKTHYISRLQLLKSRESHD